MASMFHSHENLEALKMHSPEREIVLRPMEGKHTISSKGLVDNRLFKGDNSLNAIQGEDGLWYLKQETGLLPEVLKQKFTGISKLLDFVKTYYEKRNVSIIEVKDKHAA